MSGPLTWKERNRDEVWCAARDRIRARLGGGMILDYWVIDELHREALAMVAALPSAFIETPVRDLSTGHFGLWKHGRVIASCGSIDAHNAARRLLGERA